MWPGEAPEGPISIHAPLTGSDPERDGQQPEGAISIHAPLTGSDVSGRQPSGPFDISIHAPLTGSDRAAPPSSGPPGHFNPRSPCGERPTGQPVHCAHPIFQSTLPLRGATPKMVSCRPLASVFQSTLPLRGATAGKQVQPSTPVISIHAPLAGSDPIRPHPNPTFTNFNPRSPCGERPLCVIGLLGSNNFNPRSPCGERRASPSSWRT